MTKHMDTQYARVLVVLLSFGILTAKQAEVTEISAPTIELVPAKITQTLSPSEPEKKVLSKRQLRKQELKLIRQERRRKNKPMSKLNYVELKERKNDLVHADDFELACKYLEKMLHHKDLPDVDQKELMLEHADYLFNMGKLEKAATAYAEFSNLYPGDPKIEYVDYRTILSNFYRTLDKERDQSATKKTVVLSDKFLQRTIYKEHEAEVKNIKEQCCKKLIDHEFTVIDFYLQRNSFKAVRGRLDHIKKELLATIPQAEQRILLVECTIAEKQSDTETLKKKQAELILKFPTATLAYDAHGNERASVKKAVNRF